MIARAIAIDSKIVAGEKWRDGEDAAAIAGHFSGLDSELREVQSLGLNFTYSDVTTSLACLTGVSAASRHH